MPWQRARDSKSGRGSGGSGRNVRQCSKGRRDEVVFSFVTDMKELSPNRFCFIYVD